MSGGIGLYIHVPFCAKKCPYCDFYSCKYSRENAERFTEAVIRNINAIGEEDIKRVDTVYFGGGTPSLLPLNCIEGIMFLLGEHLEIGDIETTIEVNPKTVNKEKLLGFRKAGINRLSIGVQTCMDNELEALGRMHSYSDAEKTVLDAYEVGFDNISCDLMLGIQYQTMESLKYSVDKLCGLPITHISAYMLKIEKGTPFYAQNISDFLPDEDTVCDMYLFCVEELKKNGFYQYEISNFAKENKVSKHNMKYWLCDEYIGIGPSAHSFFYGKRYRVPNDLEMFICEPLQNEIITDKNPDLRKDRVMLGLRLTEGIEISGIEDKISIKAYEKSGLAHMRDGKFSLTPKGFLVSNMIISDIISFM